GSAEARFTPCLCSEILRLLDYSSRGPGLHRCGLRNGALRPWFIPKTIHISDTDFVALESQRGIESNGWFHFANRFGQSLEIEKNPTPGSLSPATEYLRDRPRLYPEDSKRLRETHRRRRGFQPQTNLEFGRDRSRIL